MNNNNFSPWAHPFTPNHGYTDQPHGPSRNRNRNRTQWQTPAQGYMSSAPVANPAWNSNYAQQPQQYYSQGQQTHNNFAAQQAQQSYYQQWAQYYGYNQGITPNNIPPQTFGQHQQPYSFFTPSFAATQSSRLQGVSDSDIQVSIPLSDDEPIQAVAESSFRAKKEPTVYPTTKPTGRSREPKIMLPAPVPTKSYMAQAAEEPSKVKLSGRILVILDLNGTLLYRPNRNKKTMIARPCLTPFLRYLFSNFAVMVWSSARPENVASLVEQSLEEDLRKSLVAQLARDAFNLKPEHYNQNVQVYKNLELVWSRDEIQQQHPDYATGGRFGQHNTVLIDDSMLKAAAQPHNLLQISEFSATPQQMREDTLREVAGYLEVLRTQQDVSKFMMREHFEHSSGRWAYEWPTKDIASSEAAYQGGELQDKVSIESPKKKKKQKNKLNKKARKREAAAKDLQDEIGENGGQPVGYDESQGSGESDEESEKNGGVRLA